MPIIKTPGKFMAGAQPSLGSIAMPREKKKTITVQLDKEVVVKVNAKARAAGMSRSAWVQVLISQAIGEEQ